jgi:hypothetical protein
MWVTLLGVVLATLVVGSCLAAHVFILGGGRWWRRPAAGVRAWWVRRHPPPPQTRPIEDIAVLARRLSQRFHEPAPGQRFAKAEGLRRAYDAVLAEACAQLNVVHLIAVLPPGPELDAERARVEWALECAGFELGLPL